MTGMRSRLVRAGCAATSLAVSAVAPPAAWAAGQEAPEVVEGLRLWTTVEEVRAWLMAKDGIESTRMNPQDAKGLASMQVNAVDRANDPRIGGVRAQLWPIFVNGALSGLRVLFKPETQTGATFCTLEGRGAAQRLNAYLAARFGPEKDGSYVRGGLRARLHYRTYDRRAQSISEICDSRGEGGGLAQIELYLIADDDIGFDHDQPDAIDVRRSATGGLVPVSGPATP
jgi:hypothetical protein